MPDISLESFCSYMEEIVNIFNSKLKQNHFIKFKAFFKHYIQGFINIDLLSDFLESYNNFKKKPLQEALFITMIKFFRDNYIHNEENLNRNIFQLKI